MAAFALGRRPLSPAVSAALSRGWRRWARTFGLAAAGAGILALMLVSQPRTGLGRLLIGVGLPSAALAVLDDPAWRGPALYEAGRYDEAAAVFRNGGRRNAYNLGNALARTGDYAGAIEAYDAALQFNPRDADAQANRSLIAQLVAEAIDRKGGGTANGSAQYGARYNNTANQEKDNTLQANSSGEGLAGNKEASSSASIPGNSKVARRGQAEQQTVESGRGEARGSAGDAAGRGRTGGGSAMVAEAPEKEVRRVTKSFEAHEIRPDRLWLQTLPDDPGRYLKLRLKAEQGRRIEAGTSMPAGSNPW
ncbi:tetratricopeptide repeat protein [Methylobacterium sp. WL30]|uniref:tetratricopeptide repeat protein n=1 Tax=unclassified Methylobacterium TaxID=2615210 RepID=UPI0011C82031|nr:MULTISPECIES: tetratricopeptide repeat protein [unclassified Methylobacterium]TXN19894.1 tetratricopeptide repeat protein [Methylobacterium sp. WL93]TXN43634.1 tetratricopeptide repeat protein [Methylobacterium sp. WL119]TXN63316.1 tetratricopeptide repeat protein [Methylobacterium sp. WL30]